MKIVALAFALPGTSFSSSYEVFVAERQLSNHRLQLIKLVYWFLPYQPRLSEFHPDSSRIYKLRATRDRACDESIQHMNLSPTGDGDPNSKVPLDSEALTPDGLNTVLPCYRTTADDYRKAMGGKR